MVFRNVLKLLPYIYIYMFGDKSLHLMQTDDNMGQ